MVSLVVLGSNASVEDMAAESFLEQTWQS